MKLPQFLSGLRRPPHSPVTLVTTRVRLTDVDPVKRPTTTTIERPDEYTALELPLPVETADADAERTETSAQIRVALAGNCLDEYTADARDAHIDARRAGWDLAVRYLGPERLRTELMLAAQEKEHIADALKRIQDHTAEAARLEQRVEQWRQVLLGHRTVAPTTPSVTSAAAASLPLLEQSSLYHLLTEQAGTLPWLTSAPVAKDSEPTATAPHNADTSAGSLADEPLHLSVITNSGPTSDAATTINIDPAEESTP